MRTAAGRYFLVKAMSIRIGTSGWVYGHWREILYPKGLPSRSWFAHYSRYFDTVEINNSFYRLPTEAMFDGWREQASPEFLYAVKASRYLTHVRKLKDPEEPLHTFLERADHLGSALGPILYQLPPRFHVNLPRFEHFLSILPGGYTHVVEFRDPTWLVEPIFELMARYGVAHCLHDMRPLQVPLRITSGTVYIRFHGDPEHMGNYAHSHLKTWAGRIHDWNSTGLAVYAYFNNDPNGNAVRNALTLKELLGQPAPALQASLAS